MLSGVSAMLLLQSQVWGYHLDTLLSELSPIIVSGLNYLSEA